jgi:hypothetical protein
LERRIAPVGARLCWKQAAAVPLAIRPHSNHQPPADNMLQLVFGTVALWKWKVFRRGMTN